MSDTSNYGGEREWCGICQRHYPPHLFFSHKCETRREPTSEERIASLTAERDALKAELLGQVMGPTDGELDIIAQLEKERDSLKEALTRENDQCVKWADACGVAEARAESAEQALRALREAAREAMAALGHGPECDLEDCELRALEKALEGTGG